MKSEFCNNYYIVTGRVSHIKNYDNYFNVELENVVLIDDCQQYNIKGKIQCHFSNYDETDFCGFEVAQKVIFESYLYKINLFNESNNINSYYLKNNIRYETDVICVEDLDLYNGERTISEKFKGYNKIQLISAFGEEKGNIAYAILFGDKGDIDENILNVFKTSGVMHVFAVSGLHIGLIVALLYFFFGKLRVSKNISIIITSIILFIFCFLCSFSSSVVRASIMSIIFMFSKLINRKNDSLNTFGLSGLIILFLSPIAIFDVGFQMTYIAVLGIFLFSNLFSKIKIKNIILKDIFMIVAISISTQLALLPIIAKHYGYYSTWTLLSNVLTLPIFSVFYCALFIINFICLIFPFLSFLYFIPSIILNVIYYWNNLICSLPFAILKIYSWTTLSTLLYYLMIFVISKYVMINKKCKIVITSLISLILCFLIPTNSFPYVSKQNGVFLFSDDECVSSIITTKDNKIYLLNPDLSQKRYRKIDKILDSLKISKVDGIIFSKQQNFQAEYAKSAFKNYNPTFYLSSSNLAINNLIQMDFDVKILNSGDMKIFDDFSLEYFEYGNKQIACFLMIDGITYCEFDEEILEDSLIKNLLKTNIVFNIDYVKIDNENFLETKNILDANHYLCNFNSKDYIKF